MQPDRQPTKRERHALIAGIVERRGVGTQRELIDALAAAGCRVTQATVSRDIRELGLEKEEDAVGGVRYVLPGRRVRPDPRETLRALLDRFGLRVQCAQNIVVVQSEIGSAPAIARALDRARHPLVVGTLAGDDTCLVIASDADDARRLARELRAAIGS